MPDASRPRLVRVAGRGTWHIYHRHALGERPRRISIGHKDRASAEASLAAYLADLDKPRFPNVSVSAILAAYLADRETAGIPGLARLAFAHKPLGRHFGDRPPAAVTEAECRAYARRRKREGAGPGTARTELEALRAALRWAHKKGAIGTVPPVVLPQRPPARERWLTREEADRLLAACNDHHLRVFVHLALRTAARAGAILALTWDRVDLEGRRINYEEPGRGRTRKGRARVPINDTLLAVLREARAARTGEHVIEWGGGRVRSVKRAFRSAVRKAGLEKVTPHVLRHTAATWMAQAGVPLWEIAGYLGHSDARMVAETYGHHPDYMGRAAAALM